MLVPDSKSLRPETAALWQRLSTEPLLSGFTLVGGTALALRIGHRVSEDLDFAYCAETLPRQRLSRLLEDIGKDGFGFTPLVDVAAEQDFLDAGLDLADSQQDYTSNGQVKVTFFAPDHHIRGILGGGPATALHVASLDEIFRLKAIVCADRSKSRDWFDVYTLLRSHGYTMADFHRAFVDSGQPAKYDIAKMRLCSGRPHAADEGYEDVAGAEAPSIEDMRAFFAQQFDAFERIEFARSIRSARAARDKPR